MKEGWTYKKLGEVFPIIMGKTPPRNIAKYWDVKKETRNLWVSIADLSKNEGGEIHETKEHISDEGKENIKLIPKGSLLVSFKLTLGKMAFAGEDLYTNEAIISLPKRDDVDLMYLYYYFSFLDWNRIASGNEKVKGKTLNKSSLSEIPIAYIPLPEQRAIVARLDSAFAQIDALKANAEKQLSEARKLFKKALEEAMTPKEGWEEKKLGEFAYMKAGNFVKASEIKAEYEEGLFPCYGGNGFRGYVKEPNQDGDYCLIGRQGALCGCINRAKGIFRTTEHAVIVKPYKAIPTSLVYYMLVKLDLNKYATGAAQPGLSVNHIAEAVLIDIPPENEWSSLSSYLDALSSHVRTLEEKLKKMKDECDALKQAMLREVFE